MKKNAYSIIISNNDEDACETLGIIFERLGCTNIWDGKARCDKESCLDVLNCCQHQDEPTFPVWKYYVGLNVVNVEMFTIAEVLSYEHPLDYYSPEQFEPIANAIIEERTAKKNSKNSESKINTNTKKENNMEKKSMFNGIIDKFKSQFVPEKDDSLKMSMDGNICVLVNDELVSIDKDNNLTSYPKEMCIDIPVFIINKPYNQIKIGDIVKINKTYGKVLKKNSNGSLSCITYSGYTTNKKEIKDFILGQSFARVVVNIFDNAQNMGFNPMIFAIADGNMDMKDLLMFQMMQGNQTNPMLMMALMNKEGDSNSLIETMMMMQMMQGNQMTLPFINTLDNKESK